jgi:hypothetical protein
VKMVNTIAIALQLNGNTGVIIELFFEFQSPPHGLKGHNTYAPLTPASSHGVATPVPGVPDLQPNHESAPLSTSKSSEST